MWNGVSTHKCSHRSHLSSEVCSFTETFKTFAFVFHFVNIAEEQHSVLRNVNHDIKRPRIGIISHEL